MTFDETSDTYTLDTTGRRFYANNGVLGLGPAGDAPYTSVDYGADGSIALDGLFASVAVTDQERIDLSAWTLQERKELAGEMIRRWLTFAGVPNLDEPVTESFEAYTARKGRT